MDPPLDDTVSKEMSQNSITSNTPKLLAGVPGPLLPGLLSSLLDSIGYDRVGYLVAQVNCSTLA